MKEKRISVMLTKNELTQIERAIGFQACAWDGVISDEEYNSYLALQEAIQNEVKNFDISYKMRGL